MTFVNGAVFGGGSDIAPAAETDPNAFTGIPAVGTMDNGQQVQWITSYPGDAYESGAIESAPSNAVFGGGVSPVEKQSAVAVSDYVQGQATQKTDYIQSVYPVETVSVEKRIYDYAHSLVWGTPAADAVAVPKLAAMAKAQRWSNAQIANALGFRESDIADLWKRYKITFENTAAAAPAFGGTATVALAVAAAAALALGG